MRMDGARKNIVNYVLHTKQPIAIENFERSEFFDPLQALQIGSVLCVPVGLKGNLCGVVYLEHSAPGVLQEDRFELMSLLCTQLYISIENAKLYDSIQASEHRYKILAEGLPIMAFSLEMHRGQTFANSKLLQFFGFHSALAETITLEQVLANIYQEDLLTFMEAWNCAVDPMLPPIEVEVRMRRASDRKYRWTLCHVTVSFDSHNHAEMLLGTWMDIQDLKDAQAEQLAKAEIEASEKKYRNLAEAIPQIVWTSASDGEVNYFNRRWYEFTGLSEMESLGQKYIQAFHPQDINNWPIINLINNNNNNNNNNETIITNIINNNNNNSNNNSNNYDFEVKLRIRNREGEYRWHLARGIYIPMNGGGKRFGSFTDIEDQVQIELSLTSARESADRASHNQAFFVANMSHEIRTPMNGILGMLHMLLETQLNEEQSDYASTMKRSADSLLSIIDDVLDFSKIQEGKLELRTEEVHVAQIIQDVVETLAVLAVGAELMLFVHPDVPNHLIGDSGKLRQVLMNLIGNAVKFTPKGEVYTSCYLEERFEDKERGGSREVLLKFKVSDTGNGISKEKQERLFTPFYQADAARAYGGTGLGLAICKQLVTLFQGEISIESTLGKGSTFTFTTRFKLPPKQNTNNNNNNNNALSSPISSPNLATTLSNLPNLSDLPNLSSLFNSSNSLPDFKSWKVLLISNRPTSLFILEHHLQSCGIKATSVTSREDAISLLEAEKNNKNNKNNANNNNNNNNNNPFTCVIIDLLTNMDEPKDLNLQSIYSLCNDVGNKKRVIVVVNSLQRPLVVRENPRVTVLLKPVSFYKFVESLVGKSSAELEKEKEEKGVVFSKSSRVLIVEDNKVNQKVIASFLQREHILFTVANNGLEAFQLVKANPFGYFSVILLDLSMPVWDGNKACAEIRNFENGKYRHPIVALTANVQDGIIEDCKENGMDSVLSKPVDFKQLTNILSQYLPREAKTSEDKKK